MQTLSLILCSAAITAVLPADFWWLDNNVFGGGEQVGASNPAINPRNNQRSQKNNRRNKNQRNRNNKSYGNADDDGDPNVVQAGNNKAEAAGKTSNKGPKMPSGGGGGKARPSQNNKSGSPALPVTQGLGPATQTQCPDVSAMPPVSSCSSAESNCWSVGEPDWDCPDNGLCCFDGCANTCLGSPKPPPSEEDTGQDPPPPVPESQAEKQTQAQSGIGNGLLFPPPDVGYSQPEPDQSGPPPPAASPAKPPQSQAPSSRPAPAPQTQSSPKRPRPSNVAQSQQSPNRGGGSESKPYVRCPSAMECVQKTSCDFDGFITEEEFIITPDLEMLRVPLIPCVNRARDNAIDVCCRDPNYEDPWPDHTGGKGGAKGGAGGEQQKGRNNNNNNNNNAASRHPLPNNPKKTKKRKNGYG